MTDTTNETQSEIISAKTRLDGARKLFQDHGLKCDIRGPSPVNGVLELVIQGRGKVVVILSSYDQFMVVEIWDGRQMFTRMPTLFGNVFEAINTAAWYLRLQTKIPD